MTLKPFRLPLLALCGACLLITACDMETDSSSYPTTPEDRRKARIGKLTGDDGLIIGGSDKDDDSGANNPLGVNSFLWRAALDTISFIPLTSADPFGGVILTEWYEDPNARGERFKITILILDRQLRADSVKATLFKQKQDEKTKQWTDQPADAATNRKLEDAILTRARQLRVAQLGY